jgi:hypothetical protein
MGEFVFGIFIFIAVIGLGVLVFGVWLIATLGQGLFRAVKGLLRGGSFESPQMPEMSPTVRCAAPSCRADNPSHARFCRRCGNPMPRSRRQSWAAM